MSPSNPTQDGGPSGLTLAGHPGGAALLIARATAAARQAGDPYLAGALPAGLVAGATCRPNRVTLAGCVKRGSRMGVSGPERLPLRSPAPPASGPPRRDLGLHSPLQAWRLVMGWLGSLQNPGWQ